MNSLSDESLKTLFGLSAVFGVVLVGLSGWARLVAAPFWLCYWLCWRESESRDGSNASQELAELRTIPLVGYRPSKLLYLRAVFSSSAACFYIGAYVLWAGPAVRDRVLMLLLPLLLSYAALKNLLLALGRPGRIEARSGHLVIDGVPLTESTTLMRLRLPRSTIVVVQGSKRRIVAFDHAGRLDSDWKRVT